MSASRNHWGEGAPVGTLAFNVRRLRAEADLSQEELADRSGLSLSAIHRIEANHQRYRALPSVARIALALDVPLTAFFEGVDPNGVLE